MQIQTHAGDGCEERLRSRCLVLQGCGCATRVWLVLQGCGCGATRVWLGPGAWCYKGVAVVECGSESQVQGMLRMRRRVSGQVLGTQIWAATNGSNVVLPYRYLTLLCQFYEPVSIKHSLNRFQASD
jgi:hypothetical protein